MDADVKAGWGMSPLGPPVAGLAPGDVIAGKYRLEAVIGRGGMSVVYRATHLSLDQQVALKVLSAEALHLPEYVQRLRREARAVSRIRSEHVVRVHDIGELEARPGIPGVPYLVMEYLSGLDLAAVLARRGALPVELAVECILQTCEALAEAHALGIVHRDLKPANLFLTESVDGSPCVKVLDFGISRMSRRHGLSPLTDPGTVLGTPSYMAPEQMEAADTIDARSDIWGLGTILYELLVGRPPYGGDSLPQIFIKIMRSRPPKPSLARPDVPASLDAIVARCLAIEPEDRFPSVADLAWALSAVGTPRARDSAERISRVFDKRSLEAGGEATAMADRGDTDLPDGPWRAHGPAMRKVGAMFASAAILGVASVFGVLAARGAVHASARPAAAAAPTVTAVTAVNRRVEAPPDAAVVITTVTRPAPTAVAPPPPPRSAPEAIVAVSLPERLVATAEAKNKPPPRAAAPPPEAPLPEPAALERPAPEPASAPPSDGTPSKDVD